MRKEQKISQETLAVDCNVDVRTIQRIEKGEQNITMELLFSIANSLKISPEELISFAVQLK
jgi:transcriptional regulator with XRE-family HTH domain